MIGDVLRDNPGVPIARPHDPRDAMEEWAQDAVVVGYEDPIDTRTLPDPDDRRVLAAPIIGKAEVIDTCNLRGRRLFGPFGSNLARGLRDHPDRRLKESRQIRL